MAIEPASVDWASARRASYLVRQTFRYEYPEPIRDLSHRLAAIPPERFVDQRRSLYDVSVVLYSLPFGNRNDPSGYGIIYVYAPRATPASAFSTERSLACPSADRN